PPATAPAQAADIIQRCESPDGSIGYTDGNCAVFGSDAVAVRSHVIQSRAVDDPYAATDAGLAGDGLGDGRVAASISGRRSPASGCARTATQLRMDLDSAFALGDVNRIAESYHWVGLSTTQARGA